MVVALPDVEVSFAYASTPPTDPAAAGTFVLGTSLLNSTGVLGSQFWTDIDPADIISLAIRRGQPDETSSASPGTATIVLDNTAGGYDWTAGGALEDGTPARIRLAWAGTAYDWFTGYVDDLTLDAGYGFTVTVTCVDGLETLGRAFVPATSPVFAGDTAGTRIGRILDAALWPTSRRALDAGTAPMQAAVYGDNALPLIQAVTDSELGIVFVDGSGDVTFYDRMHVYTATRSTTVQATLSDSGTDVDMLELSVARSNSAVFTQARVTRDGGTEQVYTAPDYATRGLRTYPGSVGTQLSSDADAYSLASWLVGRYKTPRNRVPQVRVDATVQDMWPTLLPLTIYDRIRVLRDYGPHTIDVQLLIQGVEIAMTPDSWEMTFSTRNTDIFVPFVLGTSLLNTGTLV